MFRYNHDTPHAYQNSSAMPQRWNQLKRYVAKRNSSVPRATFLSSPYIGEVVCVAVMQNCILIVWFVPFSELENDTEVNQYLAKISTFGVEKLSKLPMSPNFRSCRKICILCLHGWPYSLLIAWNFKALLDKVSNCRMLEYKYETQDIECDKYGNIQSVCGKGINIDVKIMDLEVLQYDYLAKIINCCVGTCEIHLAFLITLH